MKSQHIKGGHYGSQGLKKIMLGSDTVWDGEVDGEPDTLFGWDEPSPLPAAGVADSAVTLGVAIRALENIKIVGLKFWDPNGGLSGQEWGIWYEHTGISIGSGSVTNPNEDPTWIEVYFNESISIIQNDQVVIGVSFPTGYYASSSEYFNGISDDGLFSSKGLFKAAAGAAAGFDIGNGRYAYGSELTYPSESFMYTNYWIDACIIRE